MPTITEDDVCQGLRVLLNRENKNYEALEPFSAVLQSDVSMAGLKLFGTLSITTITTDANEQRFADGTGSDQEKSRCLLGTLLTDASNARR